MRAARRFPHMLLVFRFSALVTRPFGTNPEADGGRFAPGAGYSCIAGSAGKLKLRMSLILIYVKKKQSDIIGEIGYFICK